MAQVGGNGNRKQTLRTNVVQPYSVGFLREKEHADYNVAVYDELEKVSTSTKHLFKGLDDVNKEIQNRTKAIDALGLQVSEDFKRVWFEFNGVKQQIGTGIKLENITDLNGVPLTGYLTGIETQVQGANGRISQAFGEIDSVNTYFLGEITRIDADTANITQEIGVINSTGGTAMEALWGVKANLAGVSAGVGLVLKKNNTGDPLDPANSEFYVKADQFNIYTNSTSEYPVFQINGNSIDLNGSVKITNASIKDFIQSTDFKWDNDTGTPGQFTGWQINKNGYARFANDVEIVGTIQSANWQNTSATNRWQINKNGDATFHNGNFTGQIHATSGIIDQNVTINGTVYAQNIQGDIGDFLINSTIGIDQDLHNDDTISGRLCSIKQQPFQQKVSVLGALLMDDRAGTLTTIEYTKDSSGNETDRLDTSKCSVGSVIRIGMGAGGSGTGSYTVIRAGSQEIHRTNDLGWFTQDSFSFNVPAGTGSVEVTYEIHNASNATARAQAIARYHVFTQRHGSVITR